jgi:hypothetical protein
MNGHVEAPMCQYCGELSRQVTGKEIYPHRRDLWGNIFYQCEPCSAYVGCHPRSNRPLGILANAELRKAKSAAHRAFDELWRDGWMSRTAAYKWLAEALNITHDKCHIGLFDVETCDKTISLSSAKIAWCVGLMHDGR